MDILPARSNFPYPPSASPGLTRVHSCITSSFLPRRCMHNAPCMADGVFEIGASYPDAESNHRRPAIYDEMRARYRLQSELCFGARHAVLRPAPPDRLHRLIRLGHGVARCAPVRCQFAQTCKLVTALQCGYCRCNHSAETPSRLPAAYRIAIEFDRCFSLEIPVELLKSVLKVCTEYKVSQSLCSLHIHVYSFRYFTVYSCS